MRQGLSHQISSPAVARQSAQTEMFASLNLMQELLISAPIARAEPPAALPAASFIDRMMRPKRPPLRTTRPPSDLTTAITQSAHAKPGPARSYLTSPEKVSKPEFTGPETTHTGKNGLLGHLRARNTQASLSFSV